MPHYGHGTMSGVGVRAAVAGVSALLVSAVLVAVVRWGPGRYGLAWIPSMPLAVASAGYALLHAPLTRLRARYVIGLTPEQRADGQAWAVSDGAGAAEWALVAGGAVAAWAAGLLLYPYDAWFMSPAPSTLALPIAFAFGAAVRTGLKGGPAARPGRYLGAVVCYLAFAAFAPFAVLLSLTAQGAARTLAVGAAIAFPRTGRRPAEPTPGPRPSSAEDDLRALRDLLAADTAEEIRASRPRLGGRLASVAAEKPATAVHVLFDVLEADPGFVHTAAMTDVVRGWLCGSPEESLPVTGDRLAALLDRHGADLIGCLERALDQRTVRRLSHRTRVLLTRRALAAIDAEPESGGAETAWTLLLRVEPSGAPATRGEWWCVLGDRAARDGAGERAVRRYVAAVGAGCRAAEPRLAHALMARGRRLLSGGDADAAHRAFTEALRLADDPRTRLLAAVSALLADPRPAGEQGWRAHLERATATAETATMARLWTGVGYVITGDRARAVTALRAAAKRPPDAVSETALLLLGLVDDAPGLAAGARALIDRYGARWHRYCPVDPGGLFAAVLAPDVAAADPDLAGDLARALPAAPSPDGAPGRLLAAHRMLAAASGAAARNDHDSARHWLETAEWLLGADRA